MSAAPAIPLVSTPVVVEKEIDLFDATEALAHLYNTYFEGVSPDARLKIRCPASLAEGLADAIIFMRATTEVTVEQDPSDLLYKIIRAGPSQDL